MRHNTARNIATQLYGLLADLADGLEARSGDAPFIEGAGITPFSAENPPIPGAGLTVQAVNGQTFYITVTTGAFH
jgi:hypothetical protein